LVAAGVAWSRPAASRAAPAAPAAAPERTTGLLAPVPHAVFAALFAVSGFTALLLQLAWVRLFGLVLGSSVYSFAGVLGVYLLGLALGSAIVSPMLARGSVAPWWFALLQLGIAVTSIIGLYAYGGLPKAMLDLGERAGASWAGLIAGELALIAGVLFVPCVLLGAVFPVATRLLQRGEAGAATGAAYAINTFGTIAGSLATGFLLLPWLGVQGVVRLAAVLTALAGLVALVLPGAKRPKPLVLAAAGLLCAGGLLAGLVAPRWDPLLMSLGTFRPFSAQNLLKSFRSQGISGDPTRLLAASQRVIYYRDGINTSVLVVTDAEKRKLWMRVGGKVDASTGDMLTQVLCGLLPAVMADSGARTLIVGHGSGVTAAATLAAGVGPTEIVELEPAVVEGSRFFHEKGTDPLDDPRVTVYLEDARTRLAHGGGEFGLIISQPSNPWVAGVNNLFTVDFYRRVRARLREDGVFCQWQQLYELSPATFRSLLASFLEVFPEAHLFILSESTDALLIAAPPGRTLSLDRLRAPGVAPSLERALLTSPEQVSAFYVGSGTALRDVAAGAELNTDERPFVEYRAPRDMIEVGGTYGSHHPELARMFPLTVVPPPGGPLADWPRDIALEWRARRRLANLDAVAATSVLAELRAVGAVSLAARLAEERERAVSATAAALPLEDARTRLASGDAAGASAAARQALANLAGAARLEPLLLLGIAEFGGQRNEAAMAAFREAQQVAPEDARAYNFEARILLASGDVPGARRALERGLARAPGDSALTRAVRALEGPAPSPM
jgi:spermidine synthase